MDLFKGALFLVEAPTDLPPGQGFEPVFGNAAATRQWLQDTFAVPPASGANAARASGVFASAFEDCLEPCG